MVTLAFLIAAFLDPVQAALVLAIVIAYRGGQQVLVAGAAAAVISETIITLAGSGYVWGELIAPRLLAALMQAAALVWIVNLILSAARSAGASLGMGRFASEEVTRPAPGHAAGRVSGSGGTADFEAPQPGHERIAGWQMRAYARRRIDGCDKEKMQP